MAALSRRNFDYTSAEIEVSKIRGSGCDIRCSWFVSFQDSGFDSGGKICGSCCESRFTIHGSRFTVHELRFTSYASRVTKTHKKRSKKLLSHYYMLTKYYFTNDFKYCP